MADHRHGVPTQRLLNAIPVVALILAGVGWYVAAQRAAPPAAETLRDHRSQTSQRPPAPPAQASESGTPEEQPKPEEPSGDTPCVERDDGGTVLCQFIIHPTLPPYVFRLTWRDPEHVQIAVSRHGQAKVLQRLEAEVAEAGDRFLHPVDVNFDGYLDIALLTGHGRTADVYRYWRFDPKTGVFIHLPELEELCDVTIDAGAQEIDSYCYGGNAGATFTRDTFKWRHGQLVRTESLNQDEESLEYQKLRNGTLRIVAKGAGHSYVRNLGSQPALAFVTPSVGWLVGAGWQNGGDDLLHTADGGKTWAVQRSPAPTGVDDQLPLQVQFLDARHGWLLYYGSRLHRTTDGGHHWEVTVVQPAGQADRRGTELGQFQMVTPQLGYGTSECGDQFLRTLDGGRTWQKASRPNEQERLRTLFFLDAKRGWLVGDPYGPIYVTADGGTTWEGLPIAWKGGESRVQFVSPGTGWRLGGYPADLYRTEDGGRNWLVCGGEPGSIRGFFFLTGTQGWAVGEKGLIRRTTDGCRTWQALQAPVKTTLTAVHFVDGTHGWAVGYDDTVLQSTDGGQTWVPVRITVR